MKIAVDLQSCQSGSRLGGIGRYSLELAKAMIRRGAKHEFAVVLSDATPIGEAYARSELSDLLPPDAIRTFAIPRNVSELSNHVAKVRSAELIREQFFLELSPDILHISSLFEGLQEDIVTSVGQLYPASNTTVTLYDLIPFVQKDKYLANKLTLNHYLRKVDHLKRACLLLAISEFSRQEACGILGLDSQKVVNISSAAEARFRPLTLTMAAAAALRKRYGIKDRFLMYTGSFDQRKNHATLIRAYGMLPAKVRADFQLVIVGNGWDAIYQQLHEVAKKAGVEDGRIVFAGHVADADLVPLYNLCDLFVFPSLAEGFGLPVLEAMSCGTPTICSNTTSLPEVIGMQDAMFDPRSEKTITPVLHRALIDNSFRQRLRVYGISRAKSFSWEESARRALDAFEAYGAESRRFVSMRVPSNGENNLAQFVGSFKRIEELEALPDIALRDFSRCLAQNQLNLHAVSRIDLGEKSGKKVGWVSTWNTRCGIASYSKFLLDAWPSNFRVFAPYSAWTTSTDSDAVVRCWQSGAQDDLISLEQQLLQYRADTVVIQFNYSFFDFAALARLIDRLVAVDIKTIVTFHSTQDPSPSRRLSSISGSLARCTALVVHTIHDVLRLEKLGLRDNVALLPQGVPHFDVARPATPLTNKRTYVIATYGFALPNKGLLQVVEAISLLCQKGDNAYHLIMVNAEYPDPQSEATIVALKAHIDNLGLNDIVTLSTQYLSDEESLTYLQQADLLVFAYQETGESSSAAVRMGLASGRPVAVTPIRIFDDVRQCAYTLPGTSSASIAEGIDGVLSQISDDSPLAKTISSASERWRAAHSFRAIAKELFLLGLRPQRNGVTYRLQPEFDLSPKRWKLEFSPVEPPMKTAIGRASGKVLVSDRGNGYLLFGPFISAAAGRYLATIVGKVAGHGAAKFDVCASAAATVLAETRILTAGNAVPIGELMFDVPEGGVNDLELRLELNGSIEAEVAEVHFKALGASCD